MTSRPGSRLRAVAPLALAVSFAACGPTVGPACQLAEGPHPFPAGLEESSGAAWGLLRPDLIWTVPDGRTSRIWALASDGRVVAELPVRLPGVWDVEDLAIAPCAAGSCLFIADVGDNALTRDSIVVWQVAEPRVGADETGSVIVLPTADVLSAWTLRYPDERHDVEAMFVDGAGRIRLVSKGSERPSRHFRGPSTTAPPEGVDTLEFVQTLGEGTRVLANQITGAGWISGTDRVALRTYRDLLTYRLDGEVLVPVEDGVESLLTLQEPQGEAVAVNREGRVALTSEAGPLGRAGGMHILRCPGLIP